MGSYSVLCGVLWQQCRGAYCAGTGNSADCCTNNRLSRATLGWCYGAGAVLLSVPSLLLSETGTMDCAGGIDIFAAAAAAVAGAECY